jgi:hypothetical protein
VQYERVNKIFDRGYVLASLTIFKICGIKIRADVVE